MSESLTKEKNSQADTVDKEQFVTFLINNEIYGVDVLRVHEIIGMTDITFVPNSLSFMKGVINLRGNVVPVVDMRTKFKMQLKEYDQVTVIIIVELKKRLIGMIVDSVSDVLEIPIESIKKTPHFSANIETDYIKCIGKSEDQLVIILDVDNILTTEELESMTEDV
jgi:purine-binding chemotaxis protein CheW